MEKLDQDISAPSPEKGLFNRILGWLKSQFRKKGGSRLQTHTREEIPKLMPKKVEEKPKSIVSQTEKETKDDTYHPVLPREKKPVFRIKPKRVRDLSHLSDEEMIRRMTGEAAISVEEARQLANPSAKDVAEKEIQPEPEAVSVKGYPKPREELDLHGKKALEAEREIRQFILRSSRLALRTVRIITGKGLHSEEGQPVLKSIAESKLQELKGEGKVFRFEWEKGNGSIVVYLA